MGSCLCNQHTGCTLGDVQIILLSPSLYYWLQCTTRQPAKRPRYLQWNTYTAQWFDSEPERAPIRTKLLSTAPFTHSHRHPPYCTFKALCITSDPKSTLRRESDEYKQAAHLFPPFLLLKISILILRNQFFFLGHSSSVPCFVCCKFTTGTSTHIVLQCSRNYY